MELPVLVDSNVYIGLLRANLDPAVELTGRVSSTDLAVCGMVRVEVLRGITQPRVRDRMKAFFDVLQNVPADNRLWDETAALAWELDRKGRIIPGADALIACSAMRIGAVLLTDDQHFQNIPGLAVRRWMEPR